jgi:hypothetical protein
VDAIFATSDRGTADAIIEEYDKFWQSIPGTRGATGKKTVNAGTMFNSLFEVEESKEVTSDEPEFDEDKLDKLEIDNA